MSYNFHKEQIIIIIILKYFACVILLLLAVNQLRPFKFKQNSTLVLNVSSVCGVGQGQRSDVALVRGFGAGFLCLFQTTMSEILVVDLVCGLLQILQVSPGGEGVKNISYIYIPMYIYSETLYNGHFQKMASLGVNVASQ